MDSLHNINTDILFDAIMSLKSREECYMFFEDVCTVKEIKDMTQRFQAAILLDKGESYVSVTQKVGISSATISRVNRCLNYGAGGYRIAIDRVSGEEEQE
ncbi:MAG: TrpR-related protein YerC/YecD [Eubacteriaceae bacterium]|nr:TrpR-related protein YerC/YecD [Eubacteriaceae bacterium]